MRIFQTRLTHKLGTQALKTAILGIRVLALRQKLKLILLFTFLRFIRISSDSTFIANFIGIFLIPAYILDLAGYLPTVTAYLDNIALNLGELRISLYIVIKSVIVLIIVFWFSSLVTTKSKSYINANKKIKSGNKIIIGKFIDIFIYCAVTVIILKTAGVQMTTLAVVGGAVGVGVGVTGSVAALAFSPASPADSAAAAARSCA